MKCLACDFGGSSVKFSLVTDEAKMIYTGKVPAPLKSVADFVNTIVSLYNVFKTEIDGITLSIPGMIDVANGVHCGSGAYNSILNGKNVASLVSDACGGINVAVENDGKCGALAEAWCGSLSDVNDGAVLILGTGIGGGVIIDKKIYRGLNFAAGEFSYSLIGFDGFSLLSEAWLNASVFGLTYKTCKLKNLDFDAQDASDTLKKFDSILSPNFSIINEDTIPVKADGKQFFRWYEAGDPIAKQVYAQFIRSLAVLAHNIQTCLAPERIVIGGGLSRVDFLIPDLICELDKLYKACLISPALQANIVRSKYLDECNILGAMYNYIQRYGVK